MTIDRRPIIGAYAASPAHAVWNPELEEAYLYGLDAIEGVRGLELPWLGNAHPHDDSWLLAHLPRRFDVVVTDVGATVGALATDPRFGLASADDDSRRRAVLAAAKVRDDIGRLSDALGRAVMAVELHSAPLGRDGTTESLTESLDEIAEWDWSGARILIEHCDADVEGQTAEKGYLRLEQEIEAIERSGTDVGLSLNWGRSAIELRDADRVLDHVVLAQATGRLAGLVLSGAASQASRFGPAWVDAHLPYAPSHGFPGGEPTSLLTVERAHAAIEAAGQIEWLGLKMGWGPGPGSVEDRLGMIADAVAVTAPPIETSAP